MYSRVWHWLLQGRIHDFKLGGGAHLKKSRRAEGGAKNFGVFRVKNHDFTTKQSYFFQLRRKARKVLGYFVWKITILRQKIIFFPILGGGARRVRPPPWIRPCFWIYPHYIHVVQHPYDVLLASFTLSATLFDLLELLSIPIYVYNPLPVLLACYAMWDVSLGILVLLLIVISLLFDSDIKYLSLLA
jgi:hypothetical protein